MKASAIAVEMQTRYAPLRPARLETRKRRSQRVRAHGSPQGSGGGAALSLDTEKQLATSVQVWERETRSPEDVRRSQVALQKQLIGTVHKIWQEKAALPKDDADAQWFQAYDAVCAPLRGEDDTARALRIAAWVKENKPTGKNAEVLKWEKQFFQIRNCQSEWIGYAAACCGARTRPIAVPIGCNHRLCPLCCWHRSQVARTRVAAMFDRITHPAMITLTIPNLPDIQKQNYTMFRERIRKFIKEHEEWILGGIYSLETTYNREDATWHIHVHILADLSHPLPAKSERTVLAGVRMFSFTAIKLRLEFDWLRLWSKEWGKRAGKNASKTRLADDTRMFEEWVRAGRENSTREWCADGWQSIHGVPIKEIERRRSWNAKNRRVVDIRGVIDRKGASFEVLKYITKTADFSDRPEAVEAFVNATRNTRLLQTFGSWYGVKIDTAVEFDPEHMDDWGEMKCACGVNQWQRMGVFHRYDVEMDADGRWHLKADIKHNCCGTVARPTIRKLAVPEDGEGFQSWGTQAS
jgi:Replication protein